jgi:hypothetical protein
MKDWVKSDRLKFKIGTLEWMNFFGLPLGFIILGLTNLTFVFKADDKEKLITLIIGFISFCIVGVLTYTYQLKRLNFESFKLNKELDNFKIELRKHLKQNDWEIDYDNKLYLQATYRGSLINFDMITIQFSKTEIKWNVIRHPLSHNSIAALITLNKQGKEMIKLIKASA